jgi:hypothetical protein
MMMRKWIAAVAAASLAATPAMAQAADRATAPVKAHDNINGGSGIWIAWVMAALVVVAAIVAATHEDDTVLPHSP